jgi:N-glycosylase/DNA lyase
VDLRRTLNSHGFAELAPLSLAPGGDRLSFTAPIPGGRPRRATIGPGRRGHAEVRVLGGAAGPRVRAGALAAAAHILRLDQDLSGFYRVVADDPDLAWATVGAGRMLRSPTVFEDVVKTICTTNCSWGLTVTMVNALVGELGEPAIGGADRTSNAFPTPEAMAAVDEAFYRRVVRAGYRAPRLVELARGVVEGSIRLEDLADPDRDRLPDEEVEERLLALPGVGPYAAAHNMMMLGRTPRLILDSWTRPKYARLTGARRPPADRTIERRFRRYGPDAGLAFWLFLTRDWVE